MPTRKGKTCQSAMKFCFDWKLIRLGAGSAWRMKGTPKPRMTDNGAVATLETSMVRWEAEGFGAAVGEVAR